MRAGGSDQQVRARAASVASSLRKSDHLLARASRRRCKSPSQLDDRLVHLRLDVFLQDFLPSVENLLNVGTELARFRIDDLEFLLDPEGEYVC